MTPARDLDISAWHNGFYGEAFYFTKADNTPVDLTGYTGKLQVRLYGAQPGAAVITLGSVDDALEGVWISEPPSGLIELRISEDTLSGAYAALQAGLEPGERIDFAFDLVLTNPLGNDEPWLTGKFTINAGATL